MWGVGKPNAPFRLNYHAIDTALHDKQKAGRGHTDKVYFKPTVWIHRTAPDTVALHLHHTDIVYWHRDGRRTLNSDGWYSSQLTKHWWGEADIHNIHNIRPNVYSHSQHFYVRQHGDSTKYYDGMQIDGDGQLISDVKFGEKNVPNAEAKAYRAEINKVFKEYRPQLIMLDLCGDTWLRRVPRIDATPSIDDYLKGGFNDTILYTTVRKYSGYKTATNAFRAWLTSEFMDHARKHHLFDVVPFLPGD